jgi:hypothetical protein
MFLLTFMKDSVIVSFAKRGRENYPSAFPRLIESARTAGFTGDFIMCAPEMPATEIYGGVFNQPGLPIPQHGEVPYGFKPTLVNIARGQGYKKVIWCDSTIFFVRKFQDLLETIEFKSLMLFDNPGCPELHWTSDDCLAQMGCSIEEAAMVNQAMACVMGFDFDAPIAHTIFDEWFEFGKDGVSFQGRSGSTRPEFRAHRHDQSVISYLAHKHNISKIPYGTLSYWNDRDKFNSHVCNRGIGQP